MSRRTVSFLFVAAVLVTIEPAPAAERGGGFRVLRPVSHTLLPSAAPGPDLTATVAERVSRARTDRTLRRGDVVIAESGPIVYTPRGFVRFDAPHALGGSARRQVDALLGISALRARREAFLRDKIVVVVAARAQKQNALVDSAPILVHGRATQEAFSVVELTQVRPARIVALFPGPNGGAAPQVSSAFRQIN